MGVKDHMHINYSYRHNNTLKLLTCYCIRTVVVVATTLAIYLLWSPSSEAGWVKKLRELSVDGCKVFQGPDSLCEIVVSPVLLYLSRCLLRQATYVLMAFLRGQIHW